MKYLIHWRRYDHLTYRVEVWPLSWVALAIFLIVLSGCAARSASPIGEMMALTAQGEVACVRNDVVLRGRKACR